MLGSIPEYCRRPGLAGVVSWGMEWGEGFREEAGPAGLHPLMGWGGENVPGRGSCSTKGIYPESSGAN